MTEPKKPATGSAWRIEDVDGWQVLIGRGARENDALTFGEASPRDIWLHAAGHAGSHVIIRVPDDAESVPRAVLDAAARFAAFHSKARNARGKVEVHVCRVADVRKPRGAPAGQVQIRDWSSVKVYPRPG
jgi:predicted ribosome quality control (RQC) complex YloA/Tae2 family protein